MTDLLAPFRRPGTAPAYRPNTPPAPAPEPEPSVIIMPGPTLFACYGVAGSAAKPQRLEVRPQGDLCAARLYSQFSEIAYSRDYSQIVLFYLQTIITADGRNLKPVVEALIEGTCTYLAELPEGEYCEDGQSVITRITTLGKKPKMAEA